MVSRCCLLLLLVVVGVVIELGFILVGLNLDIWTRLFSSRCMPTFVGEIGRTSSR